MGLFSITPNTEGVIRRTAWRFLLVGAEGMKMKKAAMTQRQSNSPFTLVSNHLIESIYTDPTESPAIRLLLFIARYSSESLLSKEVLTDTFILKSLGMDRSSLDQAEKELVKARNITVKRDLSGVCVYRLASNLQCFKGTSSNAAEQAAEIVGELDGGAIW
jgi:hypothetical protein